MHSQSLALHPPEGHGGRHGDLSPDPSPLLRVRNNQAEESGFSDFQTVVLPGSSPGSQSYLPSPNPHRLSQAVHPRLSTNCSLPQGFSPEGSVSLASAGDAPPQS